MRALLILGIVLALCCPVTVSAQTLEQAKKQQVEAALKGPHGKQITASVKKYSEKYNVDEKMVHAIILTESGYNPKAVSPCGAKGLGQLMEPTFRARNVGSNIYDIDTNITIIFLWLLLMLVVVMLTNIKVKYHLQLSLM